MIRNVLTIAGSDPSGGAGIQADIKAISANGAYAMAVITGLTAQNTCGVTGVELVTPGFVAAQIAAVFADIRVDAVKIGMLGSAAIAAAVADALAAACARVGPVPLVLDPVMIAKGGDRLLAADAIAVLRERLLARVAVLTPNLPEAAALLDAPEPADAAAMVAIAERLRELGPAAVLLKGGHLAVNGGAQASGDHQPDDAVGSPDYLAGPAGGLWLPGPRIATRNTHGTGCTLAAALAAQLAITGDLVTAARRAKAYVTGAIAAADQLAVGHGHGPTHHFHALWPPAPAAE